MGIWKEIQVSQQFSGLDFQVVFTLVNRFLDKIEHDGSRREEWRCAIYREHEIAHDTISEMQWAGAWLILDAQDFSVALETQHFLKSLGLKLYATNYPGGYTVAIFRPLN